MSHFAIHKQLRMRTILLFCISIIYSVNSNSQIVNLGCQTEDIAVEDLERKNWNGGSTASHSQGSMHNFTLPINTFGDCKRISNITIEIDAIGVDLTNLPPDCIPTPTPFYYNIHTGCAPYVPASCPGTNLLGESNTPSFTDQNLSYNGDFDFGDNLAIDIVPVMNIGCTAGQTALTSDAVILDYEICVTVTIVDETIDTPVSIGGPSMTCPVGTTTIAVGTYDEYEWAPSGEMTQTIQVGPGTYNVTVTDTNGCTDTDEIVIAPLPDSPITFDPIAPTVCDNGVVNVSVNESYTSYAWSNALSGQTVSLTTGMYDVTITDGNNCTAINSVTVASIAPPNAGSDDSETVCEDVVFDLTGLLSTDADAGGVFSDPAGTGSLSGSMVNTTGLAGQAVNFIYTVGLPGDPCGADVVTLTLIVEAALDAGDDNSETVCDDITYDLNDLLDVDADAGGVFSDPTASGALTGSMVNTSLISGQTIGFLYTVGMPTDACGSDVATLTLTVDTSPEAGDNDSETVCDGEFFDLINLLDVNADAGGVFSDPAGTGSLSGSVVNTLGLGGQTLDFTYEVGLATDPCGTDQATLSLIIDPFLVAGDDNSITVCDGTMVDLNTLLDSNADLGGTFSDPSGSGTLTGSMVNTTGASGLTIDFVYEVGNPTGACATDEAILTVIIEPAANAGDDNSTSVCEGTMVDLIDLLDINASTGGIFSDPSGSGVLTGSMVNTTGLSGQIIDYIYTIGDPTDPCGEDQATFTITITSSLEAGDNNEVELCIGGIIDLKDYLVNADPGGIFGDANGSGGLSGDFLDTDVIALGTYIYEYSFFGGSCPFDFANIEITFSPGIETVFEVDSTELCFDVCQEINLSFEGNGPFSYDLQVENLDGVNQASTSLSSTTNTSTITLCNFSTSVAFANDTLNFSNLDSLVISLGNLQGTICEAVDTLWVTSLPKNEFLLDTTICILDTLFINDLELFLGNSTYIDTLPGITCDSFININVTFSNIDTSYILETICPGDSTEYFSTWFDEDNPNGEFPVANPNGCDSLFIVDISFYEVADSMINETLCEGSFIEVNGFIYNEANPVGQEIFMDASVNGCDSIVNINLQFGGGIIVPRTDTLCEGNSIVIGGMTFDETNNPNQHTVPGLDCDTTFNINLTFVPPTTNNITGTYCSDFDTLINGNIYDINNPMDTEIIVGGNFLGCDSIIIVDLQFDNGVEIVRTDILCEGTSITIGGVVFDQNNTMDMFNVPGVDCDTLFDVDLTFVPPTTNNVIGTYCSDFDTLINGVLYDINNPSDTDIILGGNSLGCDSIIVVDLQFDNGVEIVRTDILCEGEMVTIGGVVFDQNNTMDIFNVPGVDCDTLFDVDLTFIASIPNNIIGVFCSDFDTLVNGNLYNMMNPSDTEIIVGGNSLGCDSIIIVDLSFTPCDLEVTINSVGNNCVGDSLGGFSIQINSAIDIPFVIALEEITNGDQYNIGISTLMPDYESGNIPSGTYTISILDNTGVTLYTTTETIVDLFPELTGSWNLIEDILCAGDLAQLEIIPSGGLPDYDYDWNDTGLGDMAIIEQVPSGIYAVTVTDMNGCTFDSSFTIDEPASIMYDINISNISCSNAEFGSISIDNILGGTMPYTVLLDGQIVNDLLIDSLDADDYTLEIIDSESCSNGIEQITITEDSADLLANYILVYNLVNGDSVLLVGDLLEDDLSFEWTASSSLSCIDCSEPIATPSTTTSYELTVTNDQGCEQIITIVVNIITNEVIVGIPNIFSPNNDGTNDEFRINYGSEVVSQLELTVYDRWGSQIHNSTSDDGTIIWDGSSNGSDVNPGVYIYQLTVTYIGGESETMVNDLTLIK